jgi:Super-infection exclusion protein B
VKDWISAVFDVHKLPFKVLLWLTLVSGVPVLAPDALRSRLGLNVLMKGYGPFVGAAFLAFGSLVVINSCGWVFGWAWGKLWSRITRKRRKAVIQQAVATLDHAEKAVLREFLIHGQHTIELPMNDPVVVGLINKHIVNLEGEYARSSLAGILLPFSINPEARGLMSPAMVDFPVGEPSDEERDRVIRLRPAFAREIQRRNDLLRW